jgi:hypothetical protein
MSNFSLNKSVKVFANGTLRAAIGMTTESNAALDLNDGNGNQRVAIQVNADGTVSVKGLR